MLTSLWNVGADKPVPRKLDQVLAKSPQGRRCIRRGNGHLQPRASQLRLAAAHSRARNFTGCSSVKCKSPHNARFLVVRARLEITERKYEQALATLREGFALAEHVGQQGILVSDLVGLTIQGMMAETLQSLIASPDAPNLYWAITELPDPLVSYRRALELEASGIYLLFPTLREVLRPVSPAVARPVSEVFLRITELSGQMEGKKPGAAEAKSALEEAEPIARRELLARGWKRQQVDAMTPSQAVLVQMIEVFEETRDDLFKWFYVPYWQAERGIQAAEEQIQQAKKVEGIRLASIMLPAVGKCYLRAAMRQRQIATLRVIEAIRLYAANHGGKLTESIDKIADVTIPINAITGKPFPYRLEGNTAILEADGPANSYPRQYRLTLAN